MTTQWDGKGRDPSNVAEANKPPATIEHDGFQYVRRDLCMTMAELREKRIVQVDLQHQLDGALARVRKLQNRMKQVRQAVHMGLFSPIPEDEKFPGQL